MRRFALFVRACSASSSSNARATPRRRHWGAVRNPTRHEPSGEANSPPLLVDPIAWIAPPVSSTRSTRRSGSGLGVCIARDAARGATLYTTLEPCAHHGRTPPCVDAILAAGVRRVVAAMRDPDPRTDGKGFRQLKAAGVEVEPGVLEAEALRLNEGFVSRVRRGRPFVVVKLATTLDGRVTAPGRRYLVGKRALREVHRLRDRSDAVLVGIRTVLADDPALTVREVTGRDPLQLIVDTEARTPPTAKVVRAKDPQHTVLFVARDADARRTNKLREAGVLLTTVPRADR